MSQQAGGRRPPAAAGLPRVLDVRTAPRPAVPGVLSFATPAGSHQLSTTSRPTLRVPTTPAGAQQLASEHSARSMP